MRLVSLSATAATLVAAALLVVTTPLAGSVGPAGIFSLLAGALLLARIGHQATAGIGFEGSRAESAVAKLCVALGLTTMLVTALGVAGRLRWSTFSVAVAMLVLVAEALARGPWTRGAPRSPTANPSTQPSPSPPSPPRTSRRNRIPAAVALALATAALLSAAHRWRYQPPGGAHYDDVSYHLPAAVVWLQHADLRMLRFDSGDPSTSFYPIGGEVFAWVLLAPMRSDVLARWSQLPAGVGALLLLWALTRRAGGSRWAAAGAVALALTVPRFLPDGMLSAGNDLWSAFWLLALLLFTDRFAERPRASEAALVGLALGQFVGVKYFSLLCLPALAGAAALLLVRRIPEAGRARWRHAAVGLATAVGAGGFAYLRNAVVTGNPFFPQPLQLAGWTVLPGWPAVSLGRRIEQVADDSRFGAFVDRPELLGPIWGALLLGGVVALPAMGCFVAWRSRRGAQSSSRLLLALTLLPAWLLLTYVLFTPDPRDVRYVLAVPLLAGAAFAAVLARAPLAVRLAAAGGLIVLAVARGGSTAVAVPVGALAAAALLGAGAVVLPEGGRSRAVAGVGLACLVSIALVPVQTKYQLLRQRFEGGALALEKLAGGRPVALAYFGGNRPHFYFGDRFENRVEIAPFVGPPEGRFYDFGRPPAPDLFEGRKARSWLRNLDSLRVDYVVAGGSGRQEAWLERAESPFELAAEGAGYRIWRRRR